MSEAHAIAADSAAAASADGRLRRLIIHSMELENFKSYAGVKRIGPFHKNFSAVVGPNGSGKSNVIDAMLFVFGSRAKKLRLNKVSELIHNSAEHPDCTFARVSVHFREIWDSPTEEDDHEPIPDSDLVITRLAFQDSSSKYRINERTSTFTEVTQLLKGRGIDLDNPRFLILQGEVEQISQMKPKGETEHEQGLLEFLEELIGTNKYVQPIEEASKVLEQAQEDRMQKLNRVKLAEKERDSLDGARREAEALQAKDRQLAKLHSSLYQKSAAVAERQGAEAEEQRAGAAERKAAEEAVVAEQEAQLQRCSEQYERAHKDYERLQREASDFKQQFTEYDNKDVFHREQLKHMAASVKKLRATARKEEQKQEAERAKQQRLQDDAPALQRRVEEAQQHRERAEANVQQVFDAAKGEMASLRERLEAKQQELTPLKATLATKTAAVDATNTEAQVRGCGLAARTLLRARSQSATVVRRAGADFQGRQCAQAAGGGGGGAGAVPRRAAAVPGGHRRDSPAHARGGQGARACGEGAGAAGAAGGGAVRRAARAAAARGGGAHACCQRGRAQRPGARRHGRVPPRRRAGGHAHRRPAGRPGGDRRAVRRGGVHRRGRAGLPGGRQHRGCAALRGVPAAAPLGPRQVHHPGQDGARARRGRGGARARGCAPPV